MKTLCAVVLGLVVVVGGGIFLASKGLDNPVSNLTREATYNAANAALDATGMKSRIDAALRDNAQEISRSTGLPVAMVEGVINDIDVKDWQVVPLPEDAKAKASSDISYHGFDATVTTYEDAPLITVSTDAGSATFEVPEGAQAYLPYLEYL